MSSLNASLTDQGHDPWVSGQDDLVAPPEDSDRKLEDGEPPMTEEEEELAHVL
jgi:hypothetical protein